MAGTGASFAFEGVAARPWSRRQLPAGPSQLPRGDHPMPQYARCRDHGDGSQEKHREEEKTIVIAAWTAWIGDEGDPDGGNRDDQAAACLDGRPGQRPAGGAGGRARDVAGILDCARDVGQERGQVGIGPRGERLARPRVEFVPGQPAVHERGLQRADHVLAVGQPARLGYRPGGRPTAGPQPGCGRVGRDVGGERGQVGIGPRAERLARPRVEFVPGQPALRERGLKGSDYLLAVSVARPSRPRSPGPVVTGTSPAGTVRIKRSVAASWRPCAARVLAGRGVAAP